MGPSVLEQLGHIRTPCVNGLHSSFCRHFFGRLMHHAFPERASNTSGLVSTVQHTASGNTKLETDDDPKFERGTQDTPSKSPTTCMDTAVGLASGGRFPPTPSQDAALQISGPNIGASSDAKVPPKGARHQGRLSGLVSLCRNAEGRDCYARLTAEAHSFIKVTLKSIGAHFNWTSGVARRSLSKSWSHDFDAVGPVFRLSLGRGSWAIQSGSMAELTMLGRHACFLQHGGLTVEDLGAATPILMVSRSAHHISAEKRYDE